MLDTLQHIRHDTRCWLEITTLLIPGLNDSTPELEAMTRWIAEHLGPDVPLHFTAFHPDYKMGDMPRDAGRDAGARTRASRWPTACAMSTPATCTTPKAAPRSAPAAATPLIERDWHAVLHYALDADGGCPHCGTRVAGRFAPRFERGFGRRRIPVRVSVR